MLKINKNEFKEAQQINKFKLIYQNIRVYIFIYKTYLKTVILRYLKSCIVSVFL